MGKTVAGTKFAETLAGTPETPCASFLDSYNKVLPLLPTRMPPPPLVRTTPTPPPLAQKVTWCVLRHQTPSPGSTRG